MSGHGNFSDAHVSGSGINVSHYITGSGTPGTIVKFTAPQAVGDSVIKELAGNIGIGVSPTVLFHVVGNADATVATGTDLVGATPLVGNTAVTVIGSTDINVSNKNGASVKNSTVLSNTNNWTRLNYLGWLNSLTTTGSGAINNVYGGGSEVLNIGTGAINILAGSDSSATNTGTGLVSIINGVRSNGFLQPISGTTGSATATAGIVSGGAVNATAGAGTVASSSTISGGTFTALASAAGVGSTASSPLVRGIVAASGLIATGSGVVSATDTRGATLSITLSTATGGTVSSTNARCMITGISNAGTIGTLYGVQVDNITNTGTIGTTYGVYVGDITAGTQTNTPFSFYAVDPNTYNYFAGNTGIGSGATAPTATLDVLGTTRTGDSTTNYTAFDATGHQTMVGTARPWRDELGELIGKKTTGTRITDNVTEGTADYADNCVAANDYKITNVQLNHDRDLSQNIHPHLHWFQSSASVPNWLLEYRWQVLNGAKVTAWTPLAMNTQAFAYTAGTTIHQLSESAEIAPLGGTIISDIVQFRICRDTGNVSGLFAGADPLVGNARALSFDVHIMINSIGSTDELAK
jgi:hypothetical protein